MEDLTKTIKIIQNYDCKSGEYKKTLEKCILAFSPLLKKYTYYLRYEDAENDLIVKFIQVLNRIPTNLSNIEVLSYINVSLKNEYIRLNKKKKLDENKCLINSDLINDICYKNDISTESFVLLKSALYKLTPLERSTIISFYYKDISCEHIGKNLNLSRQYVNKLRNQALAKLRKELFIGE
jgi:RNA polymerase sigma factor (sigma-70 family)